MAYYYNYMSHYTEWEMFSEAELLENGYDMDYFDFLGETFEEAYKAFQWEIAAAKNNWHY